MIENKALVDCVREVYMSRSTEMMREEYLQLINSMLKVKGGYESWNDYKSRAVRVACNRGANVIDIDQKDAERQVEKSQSILANFKPQKL